MSSNYPPTLLNKFLPADIDVAANHSVFVYSKDLGTSASNLALQLREKDYWQVWSKTDVAKAIKYGAKYVWLVGHGVENKTAIVTEDDQDVIDISEVVQWCANLGVTHVIDTCCAPRARLNSVRQLKPALAYYCKKDLAGEAKKLSLETLDAWWGAQGMVKAYP